MDDILSDIEVRVLGALIEKEITTPEYYPLTVKSLTSACNQKSNRNPIVDYDERTVFRTLDSLREKKLALLVHAAGARVPKYEHRFNERFDFDSGQTAIMCLLMLRGPQTAGELRSRSGRLYEFDSVNEVEEKLNLSAEDGPFVVRLPVLPGKKEPRWMHLFSGEPDEELLEEHSPVQEVRVNVDAENERIRELEEEVAELRRELNELGESFTEFRRQFD